MDSTNAFDLWAESFKQAFERDFSATAIFLVMVAIILLVVAVVFYEIRRANKAKQELLKLAWKKFDYSAQRFKLSHSSIAILKDIAKEAVLRDPDSMIRSPNVFENSLERYYKIKKIESMPKGKLEEIRNLRKTLNFLPLSRETAFTSTRQFDCNERCMVQIPDAGPVTHKGMCHIIHAEELNWAITRPEGPKVPAGTWARMNLTRPGDAEYTFKAQVQSDSDGKLVLSHANQLSRTQQRNWVRIDVSIPVEVSRIEDNYDLGDIFFGKIIDMSGGGLGMALPLRLPSGSSLMLSFALPGHGQIDKLPVKVVRVAGQYNNDPSKTVHSVAFEGEIHSIQEQIIQYVFEKQRQDLAKS